MKNLIDPKLLARFQGQSVPTQEIVDFLDSNPSISTAHFCRLTGIPASKIYNFRRTSKNKSDVKTEGIQVVPKSSSNSFNRYTAEEKYLLAEAYLVSSDEDKAELLRKYGLYHSDITRWRAQIKEASLEALGKRKTRSDKKPEAEIEIEELKKELAEQEKTTAKLTTLLVIQKKTFDMLKKKD
jgi:transposase-like protein